MTIYFQHIGVTGGDHDFPRTIGTDDKGLIKFTWNDIEPYLSELDAHELSGLNEGIENALASEEGFQIWGIPAGAKYVIRDLNVGDYLLLLYTIGEAGRFYYAGRVIGKPSKPLSALSKHLWDMAKFPLIVFLKGNLTNYSWFQFCDDFGYKETWNPSGQTYRIKDDRIEISPYGSEDDLIRNFIGYEIPLYSEDFSAEIILMDTSELDIQDEEGRKNLRSHLKRERSYKLVKSFKAQLKFFKCCICEFDFKNKYGEIGDQFIEAHHIKPISSMKPGEKTSIRDLIPVCSNCHSMLHRKNPPYTAEQLKSFIKI